MDKLENFGIILKMQKKFSGGIEMKFNDFRNDEWLDLEDKLNWEKNRAKSLAGRHKYDHRK